MSVTGVLDVVPQVAAELGGHPMHYNPSDKPVAVFVHGGAWSSGDKTLYVEISKFLVRITN